MVSYELTEEQGLLKKTVRDFAEGEIRPVRQKLDDKEEFSPELTLKLGELGLLGATVSLDYGGQGLDYLSYVLCIEEIARVDGCQAATVAAHNSLGVGPI